MLIVAGEVVVEAGVVEKVKDAFVTMETETRKEAGCHTYAFAVDICDPTMIRIVEKWENMEALEAHMKTPHMAAFGAAVGDLAPKSMSIKCYEISGEVALPM